jgi:hypothetical protein
MQTIHTTKPKGGKGSAPPTGHEASVHHNNHWNTTTGTIWISNLIPMTRFGAATATTLCQHKQLTKDWSKKVSRWVWDFGWPQHQTIKRPKMCFDPKEHVPGKLGSQEERKDWPIIVWIVVLQLVTIAVTSWIWIWNRLQELVKVLLPNEWGL